MDQSEHNSGRGDVWEVGSIQNLYDPMLEMLRILDFKWKPMKAESMEGI